jgi:hypothetical protein
MTQTETAARIRDALLEAVRSNELSVETMADLAETIEDRQVREVVEGLGRAGRDVYLVRRVGFINVHVRSEPPGWWNILKTVKRDFDFLRTKLGIACYFVLLIGRRDHHIADGYIATDFSFSPFIKHPGIETTKYSINEKQHLDKSKLLLSIHGVVKGLPKLQAVT